MPYTDRLQDSLISILIITLANPCLIVDPFFFRRYKSRKKTLHRKISKTGLIDADGNLEL